MNNLKQYISTLFTQKNMLVPKNRTQLFEAFIQEETIINAVRVIQENQKMMIDKWKIKSTIQDIIEKHLIVPNAMVDKPYLVNLDFVKLEMNDIIYSEFENLENYGLEYNNETETIRGNPTQSGDFKIKMKFRVAGEPDDSELNEKRVSLIINANPKSLWKDIPSTKSENNYWKEDNVQDFQQLGEKHLVIASKRGRSHANVGSFRDDDFAFKNFPETGWNVVCVADGAGSARLARQGSKIACDGIIDYFTENLTPESFSEFDRLLQEHNLGTGEDTQKKLNVFVYNKLGSAAFQVHQKLADFALKTEANIKDFHSTLIFILFKKYEFGYAILSFGVGDCPIGLLNTDLTEIKLMNWLDVGEYGGGTRFITMPEIFNSDKFGTRFGFKLVDDFAYLMLMTDGIYDPKFVVEANLEKIQKWKEFLADLGGNNEEKITVEFNSENTEIASQLSAWMDFWSSGNHDDRTLAVVF
jgi:serine/threonine protein phosphatase PrpC